jgi:hypothetical protein
LPVIRLGCFLCESCHCLILILSKVLMGCYPLSNEQRAIGFRVGFAKR